MQVKVIILFLCFCGAIHGHAQFKPMPLPPKAWTEEDEAREQENHNCLHENKYTSEQRVAFYPFNKAKKVMVVSYDFKLKPNHDYVSNRLPLAKGKVDFNQIDEQVSLSKQQVDTLTDILYNTGYKGVVHTITKNMCFNPRNALLFLDGKNNEFAYVEICFECDEYQGSSSKIKLGEFCTQKYDLLRAYFIKLGIEVGTLKMKNGMQEN